MAPLKTAIIGYGFSAKIFHLPFLAVVPDFKLHGIVQRNPKPDDDVTKDYPDIKRYSDASELFADEEVEVVIITTAPDTHVEFVTKALESGKHVVCEKAFVPTYKEATQLAALAKEKKLVLSVYQNRRWDADFLTVSKLLNAETYLGRVVEFETHFDRHRPIAPPGSSWKVTPGPGSAAIYDLGTHLLDQVVVLFGLPDRVTGFVGSQRAENPTGYDDSFTVIAHYDKRGLTATAKAGVVSPEENQLRYWVRGEKGSFKKFHLDPQESQLLDGDRPGKSSSFGVESHSAYGLLTTVTGTSADGKTPSLKSETFPTVEPATFAEFYRKFARAVHGEALNPVPAEQAAEVIRLIEAVVQSSKEGRTVSL